MTQATNEQSTAQVIENAGTWKVYTKTTLDGAWEESEELFVLNITQSIGRSTGTATLQYLTQDADKQKNMYASGIEHYNIIMGTVSQSSTTYPQNQLIKIQNEGPPPAEGQTAAEPEVVFIGIIVGTTIDFTNNATGRDLYAIDLAGMLNQCDFFGKRSLNMAGTATVFYDMLPVFNPRDRGNRADTAVGGAYPFDESRIEDDTDTYKWNADQIVDYLMWWLNNSEYETGWKDYAFYNTLFNAQASLEYDYGGIGTAFETAVAGTGSPPSPGGLVNNWVPYNKGCWNAIADLVESVGQFSIALRYKADGTARVTVVERT